MKLYGIKNCDTVKKARHWLASHHIDYEFHDLRADGFDRQIIDCWLGTVTPETLLNKRSTTWKSLDEETRRNLEDTDIPDLLVRNPTLVKRPVLERNEDVIVGFSDKTYNTFFGL